MAEIRDAMPKGTVVVNEAITLTPDVMRTLSFPRAGDYYGTRGGGIGQAVPGAIGVKVAHPDRPVLAISGDGSALYTIQALWTSAHHDLPMVWVILHNRSYRILKFNLDIYQRRFGLPGDRPYPHMDLTEPEVDFAAIARGFGVAAEQVEQAERDPPRARSRVRQREAVSARRADRRQGLKAAGLSASFVACASTSA